MYIHSSLLSVSIHPWDVTFLGSMGSSHVKETGNGAQKVEIKVFGLFFTDFMLKIENLDINWTKFGIIKGLDHNLNNSDLNQSKNEELKARFLISLIPFKSAFSFLGNTTIFPPH